MKLYLINQLNNINNLIAISYYKPRMICLIDNTDEQLSTFDEFKNYLIKNNYHIETKRLDLSTSSDLKRFISKSIKDDNSHSFVLPTNGTVIGFQIMSWFKSPPLKFILVEDDGDIYEYDNNSFHFVEDTTHIDVTSYVNIMGGRITSQLTDLFNDPKLCQLLYFIEDHLTDYHQLFKHETKKKFFISNIYDQSKLALYPNKLNHYFKSFLLQLVKELETFGLIHVQHKSPEKILIQFLDSRYKSYLLKTGTWLEHKLYEIFKEMNLDDVKASLSFLWDSGSSANNEFDLAAVYSNNFIMASCKATSDLTPDYVNEVVANTLHIGNKSSFKLIFTTADVTNSLEEKAKEFDVHIVHYTRDKKQLIATLFTIFNT